MQIDFPGITIEHDDAALILHSMSPLNTLSSAVVGGGFAQVQTIINRHLAKDYACSDPAADLRRFALSRGIDEPFVGLLTAVMMRKAHHVTLFEDGIRVSAVITAGVSNASAAGISVPSKAETGTINVILLIDGDLVPGAMVNAVKTAAEAETAVLFECGVRTPEGFAATGTSTDAIVIACTGRGAPLEYAGPMTHVGYLIGRCIRESLTAALDAE